MPRVSEQYKSDQRAEIVDAARRCFVRQGFHRTSMQDVFAEAGKSAGAVYRYFPRKDDLIVAVAAQNLDHVAEALQAALAQAGGSGIGEVLAELLEAVVRRHREQQLAPMALTVWSEALRNPELAATLRAAIVTMTQGLIGLVRAHQATGRWSDLPSEPLAQAVLLILPGFLFELAVLGPAGVAGVPDAVRALWPRPAPLV